MSQHESGLNVLLLGPPRIERGGVAVTLGRRKALALLAYLAATARPQSRDQLAELLYPQQDREHASANLRQSLFFLREALGGRWLADGTGAVSLPAREGLLVDTAEFRKLVARQHAASGGSEDPGEDRRLARAVELYRGPFLSGFYLKDSSAFEQWQMAEEESFRQHYAGALGRLVDASATRGESEQAIEWARAAVALDPLEEGACRRLMRVLAALGQRVQALNQYEQFRAIKARELDEEPDPQTDALRDAIIARRIPELKPRAPASATEHGMARGRASAGDAGAAGRRFMMIACGPDGAETRSTHPLLFAAVTEALQLTPPAPARQRGTRGPRVAIDVQGEWADCLLLAASPGQVLVGDSAERMAGAGLPRGASLKNLGSHRLADLGPPVAVFQVVHPKLPTRFPPLSTLDAVPGNLPVLPTHLVGRARQIDAVVHQLRDGGVRILTLTGPGGAGKTRLALHAAARLAPEFGHGAWFVDLAVVRRPAELAATIAAVVGLREVPGDSRPAAEVLVDFLAPKRLLLVLDNFEHLLEAAPTVAALAGSCPRVAIVVTSRELLHVRGEQEYPVPPLGSAPAGAPAPTLTGSESVRLFVERARAVSPEFSLSAADAPVAAAICERIDCLPLAIELAAAWVKALPPAQILDRLSHRLDMLNRGTSDLPDRQRTLRTEIAWSYDLLEPAPQRLFRRLSVFPGGCTVDAAEAVGAEPGTLGVLAALVDKNLLRQSSQGASARFWMLQTIQEYAGEQLEANSESGETTRRFAAWALDLAEAAAPRLLGPDQAPWLDRLEAERDNLEEALRIMDRQRRVGDGVRAAGALGWFWFRKGRFTTGARWLERFLQACDESVEPGALAQAHYHLGWMRLMLGSSFAGNAEALASFRTALALHREAHDARGEALCTTWAAWLDVDLPMNERAALADRGVDLARRSADPWALSFCLKLAYSYLPRADQTGDQRTAALEEAIRLARGAGDPFLVCQALHGMGDVNLLLRDDRSAEPWYLESLERADAIGDTWSAFDARSHLAWGYLNRGEAERARTCFADALKAAAEAGARAYLGQFLHGLATIERNEGRAVRSLRLGGAASAFRYYGQDRRDPRLTEGTGLPRDDVEKEWILGSLMSPDDAVRYALGTTT